jgi:hypothetical protein
MTGDRSRLGALKAGRVPILPEPVQLPQVIDLIGLTDFQPGAGSPENEPTPDQSLCSD